MTLDRPVLARRLAWGFGAAGLFIPLLIEATWRLEWLEQIVPDELLDWVIVVWPWSRLLVYAEEAEPPFGLVILAAAVVLNALLYTAIGALVGVAAGLGRGRS